MGCSIMTLRFTFRDDIAKYDFHVVWKGHNRIGAVRTYRGVLSFRPDSNSFHQVYLSQADLRELWGFMVRIKGSESR